MVVGEFPIDSRSKKFDANLAPGRKNFSDPYLACHKTVYNKALADEQMLPAEYTHSVAVCSTLCHKVLYRACISHGIFLAIK